MIESRIFLQDCIRRSMQSAFFLYRSLTCLDACLNLSFLLKAASAAIVIKLSWMEASTEVNTNVLNGLSELVPNVPVVVIAQTSDVDLARTAIRHGAKGYIPCTLGFDIHSLRGGAFCLGGWNLCADGLCAGDRTLAVLASPVPRPSGG